MWSSCAKDNKFRYLLSMSTFDYLRMSRSDYPSGYKRLCVNCVHCKVVTSSSARCAKEIWPGVVASRNLGGPFFEQAGKMVNPADRCRDFDGMDIDPPGQRDRNSHD